MKISLPKIVERAFLFAQNIINNVIVKINYLRNQFNKNSSRSRWTLLVILIHTYLVKFSRMERDRPYIYYLYTNDRQLSGHALNSLNVKRSTIYEHFFGLRISMKYKFNSNLDCEA